METVTPSTNDTTAQDAAITARLVPLSDIRGAYAEAGLFADYARDEAQREASDHLEKHNPLAAEMIKRMRDAYRWLGIIGRGNNVPTTLLPTLAVKKYDQTIPQHPWSNEPDDFVWGAEFAISNPLPGIANVAVETRDRIVATKTLEQGEILWLRDSGSSSEDAPLAGPITGISDAIRVRLTATDGTIYAAMIPGMEPDGPYGSSVEAFVAFERQEANAQ